MHSNEQTQYRQMARVFVRCAAVAAVLEDGHRTADISEPNSTEATVGCVAMGDFVLDKLEIAV